MNVVSNGYDNFNKDFQAFISKWRNTGIALRCSASWENVVRSFGSKDKITVWRWSVDCLLDLRNDKDYSPDLL